MKTFVCTRMRLCNYLMDKGFYPYEIRPDEQNPRYRIYLFNETPALKAAALRYFSVDCYTAKMNNSERMIKDGRHEENRPRTEPHRKGGI